ncbi:unnamed protein product [Rhizoctonia solani]|uniref:PAS domain-containing protein n=1 Tax=Rhizoctonia solani TaxID=456999 RepID=A0A8H3GN67_9AGAM|nr:unnamed protein product [Rhizoctonia solani]
MDSFIFLLVSDSRTFKFAYVSESVSEVLGFEDDEMLRLKMDDLIADEEQVYVDNVLRTAIRQNKAATVLYLQLLHRLEQRFVLCQMAFSIAGNVIVGHMSRASPNAIGNSVRDHSAEEVIVAASEHVDHPGMMGFPAYNWTGTRFPRTALLLDRFAVDCTITHCTNNAILNNETCVQQPFYRYVAVRDEASVRSFMTNLKNTRIDANIPINAGFVYHAFTLCVRGRDLPASSAQAPSNADDEVRVSVVGSASPDGIVLVIKREA